MQKATRDQNGRTVAASIKRTTKGWERKVWFGTNPATNVRTYVYDSRDNARRGDISDDIGKNGRIK